jgi:L-arabinose isomerase
MVFILLLGFGNAVEPRADSSLLCSNQSVWNSRDGIKTIARAYILTAKSEHTAVKNIMAAIPKLSFAKVSN